MGTIRKRSRLRQPAQIIIYFADIIPFGLLLISSVLSRQSPDSIRFQHLFYHLFCRINCQTSRHYYSYGSVCNEHSIQMRFIWSLCRVNCSEWSKVRWYRTIRTRIVIPDCFGGGHTIRITALVYTPPLYLYITSKYTHNPCMFYGLDI